MKQIITITLLLISFISFSQETITTKNINIFDKQGILISEENIKVKFTVDLNNKLIILEDKSDRLIYSIEKVYDKQQTNDGSEYTEVTLKNVKTGAIISFAIFDKGFILLEDDTQLYIFYTKD